jgi:uncharacterized coiled-coil DUF342 family protein
VEKTNQEVGKQINELKKEIHLISSNLKELGGQKEDHYNKKNKLDKELNSLINTAKELKDEKKEIDKHIGELKQQRESANKEFGNAISESRKNRSELKKLRTNVIPSNRLRKDIKELEYKMQTEALSFDKEKKIMKQIKSLKSELAKSLEVESQLKNTNNTDTKGIKQKADLIHEEIQKKANESSKIFNKLTKLSEEIENVKAKRNTVQLVLKGLKTQITQMNYKLSKILKDWSGAADKFVIRPARRGFDKLIHKRTEEVKNKLKAKKKLTTDDILLLQREAMGK